ncbi:MAG: amino acid permease [Sedimentisphaerales bacterium]|nr:amino acid permease [Sedimentisphaerales bacterium]
MVSQSSVEGGGEINHRKFGTFLGVFTPSVLTILGVIMYLRFGWVLSSAGLLGTVLIVLLCTSISFITALSASAVATNMAIGAGGEYFLISRSLGLTIGGAIGIPLFLCRTLSVTLYCYGLAEAIAMFWPSGWGNLPPLPWIAAGWVILTTAIAGKSAAVSLKLQVPLMIVVGLSLLALAVGIFNGPLREPDFLPVGDRLADAGGFWVVLAVFFPAVTGFTAGIGMSGDLRDPQRSIPRGTLLAVLVGLAIYLVVPVLLSLTGLVSSEELSDTQVWTRLAIFGGLLVYPGMCSAILSSAFGSALAGPRVLQSLARDGLAPAFFGRVSKSGEPMAATLAAGVIAVSAAALGNLNAVARLVTIFFLTLYVSVNLVAATESLVKDPSYRPTLRVPWFISLLGALGSLVVIFLISPVACVIALGLELGVWLYLRRRSLAANWGDVWEGVWGSLARFALYKLARRTADPRSWRPIIMLFADQIQQRAGLAKVGAWLNLNRGIMTVCETRVGDIGNDMPSVTQREDEINDFLDRHGISGFGEVVLVDNFEDGVLGIAQSSGVGGLRYNTVLFGWPSRAERLEALLRVLGKLSDAEKASAIVRCENGGGPMRYERIDV